MAKWLKQSTAATLKIGPFLDDTDGKTAETGLTISQADVRLSKNGGDIAQKNESTACTHDELGVYGCPIDTTDTGTLGRLQLWVHESGALPVWHEYMVVPANVWDSMFGADYLQTHAVEITNGLITAAAIADDAIDAGSIATGAFTADAFAADAIVAATLATGVITADAFAANAIVAATLAADCITEAKIADNAIAAEHLAANAIDFATFAADCKTGAGLKANVESITANAITATAINADAITAAKIADGAIDAATFAADVDAEVAAYVWNAAAASYGGAGTYGQAVEDILVDTGTTLDGKIDTIDGIVDAILVDTGTTLQGELDGIQADTEDLQTQIGVAGAGLSAVPWNAAWDAQVQSEVFDALDAEMTDATSLTANGLLDRLRSVMWILRNKIAVTDANGNTVIYKDDSTTAGFTVNGMLTDDSTTTTRLRAA